MKTITRTEWETKKRHGYASIGEDGKTRYVLELDRATGATVLVAVVVDGLRR